jgi:multiple sugar transport system substrate-binding protein
MKTLNKTMKVLLAVGLAAVITTACGGSQNVADPSQNEGQKTSVDATKPAKAEKPTKPAEPVTLKVAVPPYAEPEFQEYLLEPVKRHMPNVTLEKITIDGSTKYDKTILAKGLKPDLIMASAGALYVLQDTKLAFDYEPLIKKYNLDVNRFEPTVIDWVRNGDGNPDITGIPYVRNLPGLYYNKDIFDKFGVPYPHDRMTWTELRELAVKLTRTEGGVQYRGLEPDTIEHQTSELGLSLVDPKTNKASVNTEPWKRVFTLMKSIYEIPGNSNVQWLQDALTAFRDDKTLAMYAGLGYSTFLDVPDLNWDMTTFPVFAEKPDQGVEVGARMIVITSFSEHKDAAFQAAQLMVSEETQTKLSSDGFGPVVTSAAVQKAFGTAVPGLKGKNLQSAFLLKPAPKVTDTPYTGEAVRISRQKFKEMIDNHKDVNTTLRETEEAINQYIEAQGK